MKIQRWDEIRPLLWGEFFHASDLLNAYSYHQPCVFEYGQCICHCSLRTGIWMEGDISSIGRTLRESVPWMFFIENITYITYNIWMFIFAYM